MLPESMVDYLRQALRETAAGDQRYELREPVGQGGMGTVTVPSTARSSGTWRSRSSGSD